jgi:hypothetical protein
VGDICLPVGSVTVFALSSTVNRKYEKFMMFWLFRLVGSWKKFGLSAVDRIWLQENL